MSILARLWEGTENRRFSQVIARVALENQQDAEFIRTAYRAICTINTFKSFDVVTPDRIKALRYDVEMIKGNIPLPDPVSFFGEYL